MMYVSFWQIAAIAAAVAFLPFVVLTWFMVRRVRASYEGRLGAVNPSRDELHQATADAYEARLERLQLSKDKIFELVMRMEKQRNEWSALHMDDSVKHAATAAVYDRELRRDRVRIYHLLKALNRYRAAEDKPPIQTPKHLDGELGLDALPVGRVDEYVEQLKTLYVQGHPDFRKERDGADRPPDIDGAAERDELVEWLDEQGDGEEDSP